MYLAIAKAKIWFLVGFYFVVVGGALVGADQLVLTNGDKLTGTVTSMAEGKIQFKSDLLGEFTVELNKIRSLDTDADSTIILQEQEEPVKGRILVEDEQYYLVVDNQKQPFELEQITAMGIAADKIIEPPDMSFKWSGKFEAVLTGRTGNTERSSVGGKFAIKAQNPEWTIAAYLRALYAEQEIGGDSELTDDEIQGGGRVQKMISEKVSVFGKVDFEKDRIERLKLRSILTGGLGYRWIDNDTWFYENRLGVGIEQEDFEDGVQNRSAVGELSSDLKYKVNSRVDLSQLTTWTAGFDDIQSYRLNAETAATIYLDNSHHLFIKSGIKHDYDSQPLDEVKPLDTYYFTNLGYEF
ncbi:MAG: DUF481 domain-containing protein [Sedimentisphaerales bacterium]|nr:DUF481 domain-containing protein [Sedimentisphaerales bacterium]